MSTLLTEVRPGAYYDSVVLMQLQRSLAELDDVLDAGVVMGTPANKDLLAQNDLLSDEADGAANDDLVIVVKAETNGAAEAALGQVDELLERRRAQTSSAYRPKSLSAAAGMQPDADWVLVSVPGRYAADVARQALDLGKNVFLYSDNVSVDDEVDLKQKASDKDLLVMGPDCGTAIVNGFGLGFANRVRRGSIGLVAASGTGLQAVSVAIHRLGGGISQAYGTGGRDLSETVGAISARQGLARLAADPNTDVIVLISKPPAAAVARSLLAQAGQSGKPVVVAFVGYEGDAEADGVHFARSLDGAAQLALSLTQGADRSEANGQGPDDETHPLSAGKVADGKAADGKAAAGYLRGLYSGGTLAYEALFLLRDVLPNVRSNAPLPGGAALNNVHESQDHTIVDMGGDEFTVGRLHPMLDNDLRIRRLQAEAADPETAVLLLDVVLGDGAHPDPASELAPAIADAIATAEGRALPVIAAVVGTDLDPQSLSAQVERLREAGATVYLRHDAAVRAAAALLTGHETESTAVVSTGDDGDSTTEGASSPSAVGSLSAINVGIETFAQSLTDQGASVVHVEWKPPAGGNERLMGILAKMRQ